MDISEKAHLHRVWDIDCRRFKNQPPNSSRFCIKNKNSYPLQRMPRKLTWWTALRALAWPGLMQRQQRTDCISPICAPQPRDQFAVIFLTSSTDNFSTLIPTSAASSIASVISLQLFILFYLSRLSVKSLPSPNNIRCSSFRSCSSRSRDSWELVFLFCNMFSMFFPISSKSLSSAELLSVSVDKTSVDDKTLKREKDNFKLRGNTKVYKELKKQFEATVGNWEVSLKNNTQNPLRHGALNRKALQVFLNI